MITLVVFLSTDIEKSWLLLYFTIVLPDVPFSLSMIMLYTCGAKEIKYHN